MRRPRLGSHVVLRLALGAIGAPAVGAASTPADSIEAARAFLAREMDRYHGHFGVYEDVSSAGNHFQVYAKLPDGAAPVMLNASWTLTTRSGATSIRCALAPGGSGGFSFQVGVFLPGEPSPMPNFGTHPNAGYRMAGKLATLKFWARGAAGGEKIDFFVAGLGRDAETGTELAPHPDSSPRHPPLGSVFTLTAAWQEYSIDVSDLDLDYLLGGFGWFGEAVLNPEGAAFYLDDIRYEMTDAGRAQRLDEPRFVRSHVTLPFQERPPPVERFDLMQRNAAHTYDNALAVLAFLTDGSEDSLRRARLIGDAFSYAVDHDRFFDRDRGRRLRNAYAAGDLTVPPGWRPNGRSETVAIPGYWDEAMMRFFEVEQDSSDTGNNAWGLIALAALHSRKASRHYLTAARAIMEFVDTQRDGAGLYQGFRAGVEDPEGCHPMPRAYASTEHNLDPYAAFTRLFELTGEPGWVEPADHARQFALAMWDSTLECYRPGTTDGDTINKNFDQLPLDVQAWSVLAGVNPVGRDQQALDCALTYHAHSGHGFTGFDFNTDLDGVWFEGTAHMATAFLAADRDAEADSYRAELRRAQGEPPLGKRLGLIAASLDGLTTGFPFLYFRRVHSGATAWNLFAQAALNQYYQTSLVGP